MKKSEIISIIDSRVKSTKSEKYSIWTIGVTDNPQRRKKEHEDDNHSVKYWKDWKADSESDAREIEKYFLDKGMKGDVGGGKNPTYVYIF